MQNLFKENLTESIYKDLERLFGHPGILLFRGRELAELNNYIRSYPVDIEARVLDLGCGEGYTGNMLFNRIDVGLDAILEETKKVKTLATYKELIIADAVNMPFKNNSFDIIFSNSVIEHIKRIDKVLAEVSRVLTRQGFFIFTVPSPRFSDYLFFTTIFKKIGLSVFGLAKLYSNLRNRQLSHYNLFDDLQWGERLKDNALEVVYKKYYLSQEDIYEWDKICLLLRISRPLTLLYKRLKHNFYKKVKALLARHDFLSTGAGLLVVARKTY